MKKAIEVAKEGIQKGQSPFGAAVVKDGKVVVASHNTVWLDQDPSAHAEVNAIRHAAKRLNTIDLSGCTMVTTCEPCPMCLSAIHWSKFENVIYGATIEDAAEAGFQELFIPATEMVRMGRSRLKVAKPLLQRECQELFSLWKKAALAGTY